MNQSINYTRTAIALHWLIAIAIVATFGVGLFMHDLPLTPFKLKIYSWHKWAGVTIFLLVLFRLGWRFTHLPPGPPAGMPAWQHTAAELAHRFIYILMIVIPLSGWLMSSAKGFQTVYFGVLPLPDLLAKNKELGESLAFVHKALSFTLAGLVLGHAGAAIKHHFIDRDDVLVRMLPFIKNFRKLS
jgi:cytochrome b561